MEVCHPLICFFFLTLQDGNIGLINAKITIITKTEGQSISVICNFTKTGRRKYFCKDECEDDDILIETSGYKHQKGRYSIEYKDTFAGGALNVTITQLTKSDSGNYRCALDRRFLLDPYTEFEIIVKDAPSTSKPNLTLRPQTSTSVQSASTPTTTQSFRRSSTPPSSPSKTTNQPKQQQTTAGGVLLYVGLTLVIIVLLFSVAVLILCKKRATKPEEHPVEAEYANVTGASRVYEEIREDDRQRKSPVEISSTYTVKFTKPNGVETSDDHSFASATASCPRNKTGDDSSELIYSQVDFSSGAAASHSNTPRVNADSVVYSVPTAAR